MKTGKIKVIHYCNQMSLGGTERTMEIFCKYLDRERFEVYALSRKHFYSPLKKFHLWIANVFGVKSGGTKLRNAEQMNARVPNFTSILGADHVLFAKDDEDISTIIESLSPDVLHVHYSGRPELPISNEALMKKIPTIVTTNQFELENTSAGHKHVKKMFFVSNWMLQNKAKWAAKDSRAEVFYNPIELPVSTENLRKELGIPADAFVLGRVGRADSGIHDPISIKAYKEIMDENTWFLALSAPPLMIEEAKAMGLKNFIALPSTTDDVWLSKFYNTIDVLAHARRDGETFGCNLAEAMIHGKPALSHLCQFMNAQTETIGPGGYVVNDGDVAAYAEHLKKLKTDPVFRKKLGETAKEHALKNYEAKMLTLRLEKLYSQG